MEVSTPKMEGKLHHEQSGHIHKPQIYYNDSCQPYSDVTIYIFAILYLSSMPYV